MESMTPDQKNVYVMFLRQILTGLKETRTASEAVTIEPNGTIKLEFANIPPEAWKHIGVNRDELMKFIKSE